MEYNFEIEDTEKNRELLKVQDELINILQNVPIDRINLYHYIERINKINLKY